MCDNRIPKHRGICNKQHVMTNAALTASQILIDAHHAASSLLEAARLKARELLDKEFILAGQIHTNEVNKAKRVIEDAVDNTYLDKEGAKTHPTFEQAANLINRMA